MSLFSNRNTAILNWLLASINAGFALSVSDPVVSGCFGVSLGLAIAMTLKWIYEGSN